MKFDPIFLFLVLIALDNPIKSESILESFSQDDDEGCILKRAKIYTVNEDQLCNSLPRSRVEEEPPTSTQYYSESSEPTETYKRTTSFEDSNTSDSYDTRPTEIITSSYIENNSDTEQRDPDFNFDKDITTTTTVTTKKVQSEATTEYIKKDLKTRVKKVTEKLTETTKYIPKPKQSQYPKTESDLEESKIYSKTTQYIKKFKFKPTTSTTIGKPTSFLDVTRTTKYIANDLLRTEAKKMGGNLTDITVRTTKYIPNDLRISKSRASVKPTTTTSLSSSTDESKTTSARVSETTHKTIKPSLDSKSMTSTSSHSRTNLNYSSVPNNNASSKLKSASASSIKYKSIHSHSLLTTSIPPSAQSHSTATTISALSLSNSTTFIHTTCTTKTKGSDATSESGKYTGTTNFIKNDLITTRILENRITKTVSPDEEQFNSDGSCVKSETVLIPQPEHNVRFRMRRQKNIVNGGCCMTGYSGTTTVTETMMSAVAYPVTKTLKFTETVIQPKTHLFTELLYTPYMVTATTTDTMYMMKVTTVVKGQCGCESRSCELDTNGMVLPARKLPPGIFATPINEVDRSKYDIIGFAGMNQPKFNAQMPDYSSSQF